MAVDAAQPDGVIGNGGVERPGGRELLHRPAILVPAAAQHPFIRRRARGAILHPGDDLVVTRGTDKADGIERQPEPIEMALGVGETGKDRRAAEVEHSRPRVRGTELAGRPDGHDALAFDVDRPVLLWRLLRTGHDLADEERPARLVARVGLRWW